MRYMVKLFFHSLKVKFVRKCRDILFGKSIVRLNSNPNSKARHDHFEFELIIVHFDLLAKIILKSIIMRSVENISVRFQTE